MWKSVPIVVLWLAGQGSALSSSILESGFDSPANVSAQSRVQKPSRCPVQCDSYDPAQWFAYPSTTRVAQCNQTMLLDFMVQNPLNDTAAHHTIYSCTTSESDGLKSASYRTACASPSATLETKYEFGLWNADSSTTSFPTVKNNRSLAILQNMQTYLSGNCQKSTIFAYSGVEKVATGIYVGGSLEHAQNLHSVLSDVAEILENVPHGDRWVW